MIKITQIHIYLSRLFARSEKASPFKTKLLTCSQAKSKM